MPERSAKQLFQQVWELLPEDDPARLEPTNTVREALNLMDSLGVSTLPVVSRNEVLGVFSYRDFALGLRNGGYRKSDDILDLLIEDFLANAKYASATEALTELVELFSVGQVLLVGGPQNLQGMVTPADALRYFFNVASPYVLLKQIELAIRELLRQSANAARLASIAAQTLSNVYAAGERKIPETVEEMSFSDYLTILKYRKTWGDFQVAFGRNQDNCTARLKALPDLRNDVFHFRRELTVDDYEKLRDARDWLMTRIRKIEAEARDD